MIQYKRIGQICSVLNGFAFKSENYVDSGLRIIRIANVQKGTVEDSQPVYYPLSTPNMDKYLLHEGDLLLSLTGNVGRVAILGREFLPAALNQRVACLRINDTSVTIKYLFHILNSTKFEMDCIQAANGVAQKNMSTEWLKQYEIPVYPVEMQERIVKELDKIQAVIQKRYKQISSFESLVKSQFIEMFGGYSLRNKQPGWVKVGAVAEVVGGSTPKTDKPEYWDGDFYWITPAEIKEDDFIVTHTQRSLTEKGVDSCSLRRLPVGTVLLSSRAPIGKVAIAGVEMYCNQGFKNLICGEELNSVYVYALLKYNSDYLNSLGRGATFKEISKSIVENIYIPVPAIALQNEFARFVEQTDKSKFRIKQSLEKLEILYKALLQKYFG